MSQPSVKVVGYVRTDYNWSVLVELDRDTIYSLTRKMLDKPLVGDEIDLSEAHRRVVELEGRERRVNQFKELLDAISEQEKEQP